MALFQQRTKLVHAFQMTQKAVDVIDDWPDWMRKARERGFVFPVKAPNGTRMWAIKAQVQTAPGEYEQKDTMIPFNDWLVTSKEKNVVIWVSDREFTAKYEPVEEGLIINTGIGKDAAARAAVDAGFRASLLAEYTSYVTEKLEVELTRPEFLRELRSNENETKVALVLPWSRNGR